jgi:hypothetical protein
MSGRYNYVRQAANAWRVKAGAGYRLLDSTRAAGSGEASFLLPSQQKKED